ncbi:hypothetical protein K8N75_10850 [Methanobacterium sp. VT]|uniref:Uncharacterized protein n=2 Tax=Methanobacterium spitsbergense TaxID=2874285 RepID=A0A8T5US69_9EURY|nr:hypothetical protein [Methanobacterium spitsbergense]
MITKKPKNIGLKSVILLFVLFFSICAVSAHQPRLEVGVNSSMTNPIVVKNPEISQAWYGKLNGQPDYYMISSDKPFELFANILVPQSPGISSDFMSAQITDSSGKTLALLGGNQSSWTPMFEEFGGDYYLQGPTFDQNVSAGTYYIKVFNHNNTGKYSLATGAIEAFPADESLKSIISIPLLKEQIFGKPVTILFFEFLGIILALGTIMVLFVMTFMARKSEELAETIVKFGTAVKWFRPMMWLGITITTIVWIYVMSKDPLNIVGLVNSIVLLIAIILSWYVGSKISKMKSGKIPIISTTILVLIWWLFVYWAIAVI